MLKILHGLVVGALTSHPYKSVAERTGYSSDQARDQRARRGGGEGGGITVQKQVVDQAWTVCERYVSGSSIMRYAPRLK